MYALRACMGRRVYVYVHAQTDGVKDLLLGGKALLTLGLQKRQQVVANDGSVLQYWLVWILMPWCVCVGCC